MKISSVFLEIVVGDGLVRTHLALKVTFVEVYGSDVSRKGPLLRVALIALVTGVLVNQLVDCFYMLV